MSSDDVVDLTAEREQRESRYDGVVCSCGSAWWDAAVTFTKSLRVSAYGVVRCRDCGSELPL